MKAVISRFLPALATTFGIIAGALVLADPHGLAKNFLLVFGSEAGGIAIGYAVALATINSIRIRRNGADRRHALAGLAAPLLLGAMSPLVQAIHIPEIFSLSVAAGIVTAFLFWAGLSVKPRTPKPSLEELEQKADDELALLDPTWRDGVRSINSPERIKRPADRVA